MYAALGFLAASAAGAWAWCRWLPRSFWYLIGFPLKAVRVYLTWRHVAYGCTLTRKRRVWRLSLDALPGLGTASVVIQERRRVRRVDIERAPAWASCGRPSWAGESASACTTDRSLMTT